MADPLKHVPHHMCYHTKFRSSISNRFGVGRGFQIILGMLGSAPWERCVVDPFETLLYQLYYHAKFGHYRSSNSSVILGGPSETSDLSRPAFQCHSVIGTDTDPSAT